MNRPDKSYHQAKFDNSKFYTDDELADIKKQWTSYIDERYSIGYSEENTCTVRNNTETYFDDFGIVERLASMWGRKPEDVHKCRCTIIENNVFLRDKYQSDYDENCNDYFAWISYDDDDEYSHRLSLIQPNIKLFSMQFPGGGDYESDCGSGKIVRLKVELINR